MGTIHILEGADHLLFVFALTGFNRFGRPSIGSWVTYGLGSENENLPAYVAITDIRGEPPNGKANWSNGFLPAYYQGTTLRAAGRAPDRAFGGRREPAAASPFQRWEAPPFPATPADERHPCPTSIDVVFVVRTPGGTLGRRSKYALVAALYPILGQRANLFPDLTPTPDCATLPPTIESPIHTSESYA